MCFIAAKVDGTAASDEGRVGHRQRRIEVIESDVAAQCTISLYDPGCSDEVGIDATTSARAEVDSSRTRSMPAEPDEAIVDRVRPASTEQVPDIPGSESKNKGFKGATCAKFHVQSSSSATPDTTLNALRLLSENKNPPPVRAGKQEYMFTESHMIGTVITERFFEELIESGEEFQRWMVYPFCSISTVTLYDDEGTEQKRVDVTDGSNDRVWS